MDRDTQRLELVGLLGSHLMDQGLTLKQASQQAHERVLAFERSAQAAWTPATGGMPDTPKPVPGDNLLVVEPKTRYRDQFIHDAEVTHMARFKVRMTWVSGGRTIGQDFDIRTRYAWDNTPAARRMSSASGPQFFTREQWMYELRRRLADEYLKERGIYPGSVRGPLSQLLYDDTVGFANALRRLEGLVEL